MNGGRQTSWLISSRAKPSRGNSIYNQKVARKRRRTETGRNILPSWKCVYKIKSKTANKISRSRRRRKGQIEGRCFRSLLYFLFSTDPRVSRIVIIFSPRLPPHQFATFIRTNYVYRQIYTEFSGHKSREAAEVASLFGSVCKPS